MSEQHRVFKEMLKERDRLVAALWRYGKHEEGCPVIFTESLCTCGLTAVRGERGE